MYKPVDTLTPLQVTQLHQLYQQEWWCHHRALADVEKMLSHTDYLFGFCEAATDRLVAFARVLTDRVYRAAVFDVIVAADHRGNGLGQLLVEHIVSHPDLSQVETIQLTCLPEMVPFYKRKGFAEPEQLLMIRPRD